MTDQSAQPALNVERLFRTLAEHNVNYVVIGGVAANLHGTSRLTRDCDLVIDQDAHNLQRTIAALGSLRARARSAITNDEQTRTTRPAEANQVQRRHPAELQHSFLNVDTDAGPVDILPHLVIAEHEQLTYRELERSATVIHAQAASESENEVPAVVIKIASIEHLVLAKTYIDRPHDRNDVTELTRIQNYRKLYPTPDPLSRRDLGP